MLLLLIFGILCLAQQKHCYLRKNCILKIPYDVNNKFLDILNFWCFMNKDYIRLFANWKNSKETGIILNRWLIWYFAPKKILVYYLYSINRFCYKIHKYIILGLKIDFHLITFIAPTIFVIHFSKLHIVSLVVFSTIF